MSLSVTSYGAAGVVTGSCHLVEMDGVRILIDLGLFQGSPEVDAWNRAPLDFDVNSLDAVLITHGHLDHIGRMPLLVQAGYKGPIYTISSSRDVVRLILMDGARVQAEDYRRQQERSKNPDEVPFPLYTEQDVFETLDLIEAIRVNEPFEIKHVAVRFGHAGHILGSAFIEITGSSQRFLTTGDLGHWGPHVVPDPDLPFGPVDVLMMESTYGNKTHPYMSEAVKNLVDLMHETMRNKGNLLIPSFALERTQDVLHQLRMAHDKRRLPDGVKIYLDSPLGIKFTQLYARHPEQMSDSVKRYIKRGESPFRWDNVQFTIAARESRAIQEIPHGVVVLAGSGMANGGRILNHLKKNISREESAVAFVGFQAEGTIGRQLMEGAKEILIDGERYEVKCKITDIDGFSVHADQPGLLNWANHAGSPKVLLVHGEDEGPIGLKAALEEKFNLDVTISEKGKTYEF